MMDQQQLNNRVHYHDEICPFCDEFAKLVAFGATKLVYLCSNPDCNREYSVIGWDKIKEKTD